MCVAVIQRNGVSMWQEWPVLICSVERQVTFDIAHAHIFGW